MRKDFFNLRRNWHIGNNPKGFYWILAQPLMLGKVATNNLELIDVDLDPCPY
jgi:hypothetical protein